MRMDQTLERLKKRGEHHKRYLHSPAHNLADELVTKFADKKHFGAYLKLALTHDEQVLRKIAGEVLENPNAKNPAKLFMYLVKQSTKQVNN